MPAERFVILDGYNLIHRTPSLRPGANRTLRESREKLVNLLSWAVGGGQAQFLVIFDGASETGPDVRETRVEVRFSKPPQTADDLIRIVVEREIDRHDRVTVVTADLEVARHARAMGAEVALSDLFISSILGPLAQVQGDSDPDAKPPTLSKKEVEEWAEIFRTRRPRSGKQDPAADDEGSD
jgi:predicted RNA-binding protein with PIN domain